MHMAFASSSRHWELPALLLVWKALGLVWKAALRATAEDRVSLSGCGPGKRGGSEARLWLWSNIPPPLLAGWSVIPGTIPHSRGRGWGLGDGHRVRTWKGGRLVRPAAWGRREIAPCWRKDFFFHETFSAWSPWICGLVGVNDICVPCQIIVVVK